MITVIENGIEVQAETIAQAKRALAKASRIAKKQNELAIANRRQSEMMADANSYRLMASLATTGAMAKAWKLRPVGNAYGDCDKLPERDAEGRNQFNVTTWSKDGPQTAIAVFYPSDEILNQICNSQGCIGLHVRWMDGTEQILGIGMFGGEFSYSVAHGVNSSMFAD